MSVPATLKLDPIVNLLAYQRNDIVNPARFNWCNWSRQVGKSFSKSLKRLLRGIERRRLQVLLSAGERQSRELMDKVRMHCKAMQIAADYSESTFFEGASFKQLELSLPNGVRVLALPANPNTARGFTGDVLLDEFAMHAHDREIWASLYPTIMRGEGELDVCSTPKGKANMFYQLASNPAFHRSTVTILDAVRDGLPVNVDELKAGLGDEDLWRQEFMCEFLDQAMNLLKYEDIAKCEDEACPAPVNSCDQAAAAIDQLEGENLFFGVDIGRLHDLTVIWVIEPVENRMYTRLVIELRNVPFREQQELISALLRRKGDTRCCIDAGGIGMALAEAAVEDFGASRVEAVMFTVQNKGEMANPLALKVQDGTIRIPATHEIRNDWHAITRSPTATGAWRYLAERTKDGHSDRFWAACLAVRAATSGVAAWRGEVASTGRSQWQTRREEDERRHEARPACV